MERTNPEDERNKKEAAPEDALKSTELGRYIIKFLEYCVVDRGHSELTKRNYLHYLRRFHKFAQDNNIRHPRQITSSTVHDWRMALSKIKDDGKPLSKTTVNYHAIALRSFLKFLAKQDVDTLAPEKIELADQPEREIHFLEPQEVERLIESCDNDEMVAIRNRAILEVLFSTGLRVSELAGLKKSEVNLERGEFSVSGKGGKRRLVFLSDTARSWLGKYLQRRRDKSDWLFVGQGKGKGARSRKLGVIQKKTLQDPSSKLPTI